MGNSIPSAPKPSDKQLAGHQLGGLAEALEQVEIESQSVLFEFLSVIHGQWN